MEKKTIEYEKIIKEIMGFIPNNLIENFYKNFKKLTIEENDTKIYKYYDFNKNKIFINLENNTLETEQKMILNNHIILCGLLLMSATNFKKIISTSCGFGQIRRSERFKDVFALKYEGLTIGYVELIANRLEKFKKTINNENEIAMILAEQLEQIVGEELMKKAFFGEKKNILHKAIKNLDEQIDPDILLEQITIVLNSKNQGIPCEDELNYLKTTFQKLLNIKKEKELHLQKTMKRIVVPR